VIDITNILL